MRMTPSASAAQQTTVRPSPVRIENGWLQGVNHDGITAFKGVPFARPPVGALRWRAPQPAKHWSGVRQAVAFGPDCMQLPLPGDAAPLDVESAEDCLYLNLWRPSGSPSGALPVMVWIYGGGFVNGGSSPAVYDGSQFARQGVVLISFNYRLGRFGFFAHPALTAAAGEEPLGNYAFLDQLAVLHWVQRNVARFGGDPTNVTIFGESAGGMSVHVMMTSPLALGLFQKAIVESGAGRTGIRPLLPLRHAAGSAMQSGEDSGIAFAQSMGIAGKEQATLDALRGLSAVAVRGRLNMATMGDLTYAGPMIDGKIVTAEPAVLYQQHTMARVSMIIGSNSDDGFFMGGTLEQVLVPYGQKRDAALALLDPANSGDVRLIGKRAFGDRVMIEPARFIARVLANSGQSVYAYRFSYVAALMRDQWRDGAPHASEIPYAFDTLQARYGATLSAQDSQMAATMQRHWVQFAKTGDPNPPGQHQWTAYDPSADLLMNYSAAGAAVQPDPLRPRLDLAESLVTGVQQ